MNIYQWWEKHFLKHNLIKHTCSGLEKLVICYIKGISFSYFSPMLGDSLQANTKETDSAKILENLNFAYLGFAKLMYKWTCAASRQFLQMRLNSIICFCFARNFYWVINKVLRWLSSFQHVCFISSIFTFICFSYEQTYGSCL